MAALNISPSEVRTALGSNNYLSAVGATKGSMISVNLVANTDLRTPEEFQQLVVRQKGNTIVRLRDVADVVLGAESYDEDVRFSGAKATFMGVWVLPTSNSLDVISAVRAENSGDREAASRRACTSASRTIPPATSTTRCTRSCTPWRRR